MTEQVYLAGPIHHAKDYGKGWREWLKENRNDFKWADPLGQYNTMQQAEEEWTNTDVIENDLKMIDNADAVLVHWDAIPTAGTPMEVFYTARNTDNPIVVQTKLHDSDVSPWIEYHVDTIVETFDEAIAELHDRL